MPYQISMYFTQFGRGWSENIYSTLGTSPSEILADIASNLGVISNFRASSTAIVAARVRDVASTRNSSIRNFGAPTPINILLATPPDVVTTSLPMVITTTGGPSRRLWVRGLIDLQTNRSQFNGLTVPGALAAPMASYFAYLRGGLAGAVQRTTPATLSGLLSWQNVTLMGVDPLNPNWTLITLSAGSVLPALNQQMYFRGFPNGLFQYLKGNFAVKSLTGTTGFSVAATWREPVSSMAQANVQARQRAYTYLGFADYSLGELSSHRTGGPTIRPRGRRSASYRRRLTLVA